MKKLMVVVMALAFVLTAGNAMAATSTDNLDVTATVIANCTITTTAVAFSSYDPVVANASIDLTASGNVQIVCTKGTSYSVSLNGGGSGDILARVMTGVLLDTLGYQLYTDSGYSTVFGDGVVAGSTVSGTSASLTPINITVYGSVPAAQDVSVDSYSDTVVATVTY